jgi:nitroimidazol reductase NimA-like FMN-containing flavoprotein (pyridoxamine 5'-phosphate oxidase superfamily)
MDLETLGRLQEVSYARAGDALARSWPRERSMTPAELGAFLEARHYCVLATSNAAGHPLARPVAFTVVGSAFWFATVCGTRLRNLERTPWVSVVIDAGSVGTHRAVAVDGPVTITPEPAPALLDLWERRHGSRAEWAAAWLQLQPERLISYSARSTGN